MVGLSEKEGRTAGIDGFLDAMMSSRECGIVVNPCLEFGTPVGRWIVALFLWQ
jgi:hypothetical protein